MQQTAPTHTRLRTLLVGSLIASLCAGAAVAIVAILTHANIDDTTARVLGTAFALTVYSLTGLAANGFRLKRPELGWLGQIGLLASGAGLVVALASIWTGDDSENAWRATTILLTSTLAIAHSCLLLRTRLADLAPWSRLVRRATVIATYVLALLVDAQVLSSEGDALDWRVVAVAAVLFLLGNVLVPLVRLLEPRR